jgi:hypothetical protein
MMRLAVAGFLLALSESALAQSRCGGTRLETLPGQSLSEVLGAYVSEHCPLNALMWATYQSNPHAFYGSIHHLRADTVLELPPFPAPDESQRLEANRQINAQRAIFERYRSLIAKGVPKFRARQMAAGSSSPAQPSVPPPKVSERAAGSEQLKLAPVKPEAGASAAGSEQALMNELALREAQARIQLLEQQLADLKRLLEQREQLQAGGSVGQVPSKSAANQSEAASNARPQTAAGSDPGSDRVAPAWLQTTEGSVLVSLLLTALLAGFVLLWRMRSPISPSPSTGEASWPPELRQARDAINRAAGRDAALQGETDLEKAVAGRFPLPKLDFVQGVRDKDKAKPDGT